MIAAKTNWKNIIVAIGKPKAGMPEAAAGTVACWSMNPAESAEDGLPQNGSHCSPNDML